MSAQLKAAPGLRKHRDGRLCGSCAIPLPARESDLCEQCAGLVELYKALRAVRSALGWRS